VGLTGHSSRFEGVADADLVAIASGDLDAFGERVRRHQDFVYGAALRVVRNPVLAEDVAQEAFVRAYKALPDFRGQAQVRSWLYRIATNLALNAVSRRREYPQESMPEVAARRGPERETELAMMRNDLESAIAELPPDMREALVLREFDGRSYQEIADRLDLPLNTVRTRILRARRALRSNMEEWR
jgi:RNA polymerase sigma-70 factor (ECF subfamily)